MLQSAPAALVGERRIVVAIAQNHAAGPECGSNDAGHEVGEDQEYCRVAARNRALVVEKKWVDCRAVHPRMPEDY